VLSINADNVTLLSMHAQYVETFIVYMLGECNFTAILTQWSCPCATL